MYKIITQQKSYDYYVTSLLCIHKIKGCKSTGTIWLSVHLRPYLLHNSFFFFFYLSLFSLYVCDYWMCGRANYGTSAHETECVEYTGCVSNAARTLY